jgi:hypothetical protein
MRIYELLLEYRRDITAQKLGDKLLASAEREGIKNVDQILAALENMDPTSNKQYTLWIANQYNKGQFRLEDSPRIKAALERFIQAKSRLPEKDIGRYDFYQLEDAMEKIFNPDVGKQEIQTTDTFEIPPEIKNEVEVLYNGLLGLLAIPRTKKASCILGSGTRWCTAGREGNMFSTYNRSGPLYIWRDKNGEKYQFHFSSNQYMNERDRPMSDKLMSYFSNEHPVLKKLFDLGAKDIFEKNNIHAIIDFVIDTQKIIPKELENTLLKNPRRALKYLANINDDLLKQKKWPELEKLIIDKQNAGLAYEYAMSTHRRFREAEQLIAKKPEWACKYAINIIKSRWPTGEKAIAKKDWYAYLYARDVIKGRFPEGEKEIAKNPRIINMYRLLVKK